MIPILPDFCLASMSARCEAARPCDRERASSEASFQFSDRSSSWFLVGQKWREVLFQSVGGQRDENDRADKTRKNAKK
jgi:hypothetical protein